MRVGGPAKGTGAPSRVPHTNRQTKPRAQSKGLKLDAPCRLTQHEDMKKPLSREVASGCCAFGSGRQARVPKHERSVAGGGGVSRG